jgi:hypothetical protein
LPDIWGVKSVWPPKDTTENIKVKNDASFFDKTDCDRCGRKLDSRIMSWFTDDTICMKCSEEEDEIKKEMRKNGHNPNDFEGCGRAMFSRLLSLYG